VIDVPADQHAEAGSLWKAVAHVRQCLGALDALTRDGQGRAAASVHNFLAS